MTEVRIGATIGPMIDEKCAWVAALFLVSMAGPARGREPSQPKSDAGAARDNAEVEISGTLKAPTRPPKLVAFVSAHRCDPKKGAAEALKSVAIDPNVSMNFFLEIFVPQGFTGHVCGAGYDREGKLVLFGAYGQNPLTFRGKGEVTFSQVTIALEPLSKQGKPAAR